MATTSSAPPVGCTPCSFVLQVLLASSSSIRQHRYPNRNERRPRMRRTTTPDAAPTFAKSQRGAMITPYYKPYILSTDMLILFVSTFSGLGCSLTAIDNLGQIGKSLGYPTHTISTFVSLVSIWNYFGRVFSGFVSAKLVVKWKVPRTLMMTLSRITTRHYSTAANWLAMLDRTSLM